MNITIRSCAISVRPKGGSTQTKQGGAIGIAYQVQYRWRSEYGADKSDPSTQQALHAITREGFHSLLYKGARYAGAVSGGGEEERIR